MDLTQAIRERHSVRAFQDRPISAEDAAAIAACLDALNAEGGLHMQLVLNEPLAFSSLKTRLITHYGRFSNVKNYIALVGCGGRDLEERCGYYGEYAVLRAQQLGLRTCWVAGTYRKVPGACALAEGEKIVAVIAIGYGSDDGRPHKSKAPRDVMRADGPAPDWFMEGIEAALLAPTAINQQRFLFEWRDGAVHAKALAGPFSRIDLGIVKCHFEIGSGIKRGLRGFL